MNEYPPTQLIDPPDAIFPPDQPSIPSFHIPDEVGPQPLPSPWPDWFRCLRFAPVSGRYEGSPQSNALARSVLDLRVDVDPRGVNSPVTNKLSGDLYRIQLLPFPALRSSFRVYVESWIVDNPVVRWSRCNVEISGSVRYWSGSHPATTIKVVIGWAFGSGIGPAQVTFTAAGGTPTTYNCAYKSKNFREVAMEIDVCSSVNAAPLLPLYDTHWHDNRPADTPHRTLTLESAYVETGIGVTIDPVHTVINDSAASFASWSAAELHDAMETHYSQFGGAWPAWKMWGLLAGLFDNPGVGGIMFDAAGAFGGAGKAPERQGFAVFRRHQWFDNLVAGVPANQAQAWAMRHYLYTFVHEAGHAYNFLHSWDKNRPSSRSWMNYDWKYDAINGADTFWKSFRFRFDDEELIHIRHGDRKAVIMGGDPWSSGGHLETPPLAYAQAEGDGPLEVLLRAESYFEFMEPVAVEVRLRNLTTVPLAIDPRLAPEYGAVSFFISKVGGPVEEYHPLLCYLAEPESRVLEPAETTNEGADRYSQLVSLVYGGGGFYFDRPGEYLIRAIYQSHGEILQPSNVLKIRIGYPGSRTQEEIATNYFSSEVGLSLYLGGSKSPFLSKGMDLLAHIQEREPESKLGAKLSQVLAQTEARAFHRLEDNKLKQIHVADPEKALQLTEAAVKTLAADPNKSANLVQSELTKTRVRSLQQMGESERAGEEMAALQESLGRRGVHRSVLDAIARGAQQFAPSSSKSAPKRRGRESKGRDRRR
jgi:hypothetical protein